MSAVDPHGIPWKELIIPQATNFTIFIGLLVYLLKKPLQRHFSGKNEEFEILRKKAEEAKLLAETKNQEVRTRLKLLEENADNDLSSAKTEAMNIRAKLSGEAKSAADKMIGEAEKMAIFEHARAVAMLRQELIEQATLLAKNDLDLKATKDIKSKLLEGFISKIQVAKT